MTRSLACGFVLLIAGAAGAQEPGAEPANPHVAIRMTPTEISAHNASLAPADPQFIKCVRAENPGSMVKRRVCRTNADWTQRADIASREARDIVDSIQLHGSTRGQEPVGSLVPATPN